MLIGAAAAGERARVYEAAVLKTLGATRARNSGQLRTPLGADGGGSGLVALAAGILAGWAVMVFVMESDFAIAWGPAVAVVAGGALAVLLAGLAFAWRPLAARPARVLRAMD